MTRGQGQGVGGPRQGLGQMLFCKCTKCGRTFPHAPGIPCKSQPNCPFCGGTLGPFE